LIGLPLLSHDRLSRKPMLFKSFTGLTVNEFDDIYDKEIAKRYRKHEIKRLSNIKDSRERSIGAGRHFKLDVKNRFLMLLVYYRLYITYTLAGFLFDLDQSSICRDIQKIEPLVRKCVPIPQEMHKTTKRLRTAEEVERHFPGFLSFIDCTEQQIPRPENKRRRKAYYSGKKKRHTVKTQLVVNNSGIIIHKTKNMKGHRHDYDIHKNHPVTPNQVINVFDLGYIGVEKDYPEQLSSLPYKKKKDRESSTEEKEYNHSHSGKRMVIEHSICRMKKHRIMTDIFRNSLKKYGKVSDIVSGLVNYRISSSFR
jgi:hypothetical protein